MKIHCKRMTRLQKSDAEFLLTFFLRDDEHYLRSSRAYGDRGPRALKQALTLFLRRSDLGFVWLAYVSDEPAGICVVSFAISTSIGGYVAKLDDVFVAPRFQRTGVASKMLTALFSELRRSKILRIDTSVYEENRAAARLYKKLGFRALGERRLALIL